jgi:broad specificity phosphatase PhoE
MNRRTDLRLVDAALTQRGMAQAEQLLYNEEMQEQVELVVSSPLTRALHTAVLGFAEKPILIHYDLAELGCRVPENTPRKMKLVLNDVDDARHEIDSTTLQPSHWPHTFDRKPRAIRTAMEYLYSDRQETCIAVVCHYNIIRALLSPASVQPDNADPIRCLLHWDSTVTLDGEANEGANLDSEQVNNDSQIDEIDL